MQIELWVPAFSKPGLAAWPFAALPDLTFCYQAFATDCARSKFVWLCWNPPLMVSESANVIKQHPHQKPEAKRKVLNGVQMNVQFVDFETVFFFRLNKSIFSARNAQSTTFSICNLHLWLEAFLQSLQSWEVHVETAQTACRNLVWCMFAGKKMETTFLFVSNLVEALAVTLQCWALLVSLGCLLSYQLLLEVQKCTIFMRDELKPPVLSSCHDLIWMCMFCVGLMSSVLRFFGVLPWVALGHV